MYLVQKVTNQGLTVHDYILHQLHITLIVMYCDVTYGTYAFTYEIHACHFLNECIHCHSSEKSGLRSTFLSSEMLQNLPYL